MKSVDFLRLFQHQRYTLAYIQDGKARSFPCLDTHLEKGIEKLAALNNKGAEIYFMVNEGNGEWNESKTACHGSKQVINLSALFLDAELADGSDPWPAIQAFCTQYFYLPDAVVNTSPNRYHCYWLLKPEELTKQNIVRWKQLQSFLHSKLSIDRTMTDIPQLLRIPGFKNIKKNFHITVDGWNKPQATSLDYCYTLLSKNFPELKEYKPFEPLPPVTEDYKVPFGERHEELLRRARKLHTIPSFTDEDVRIYIHGFIRDHVLENVDFLPGGKRHQEVERILSAAKGYAEEEKLKEATAAVSRHIASTEKNSSPFTLDPDFFYQAPGLVGELTRHIVDTASYPIPSHAFAAAVSIVGFVKSRYIQGPDLLPPLNYFLCLGPAGGGKTFIQRTVKDIFKQLQLSHHIEDGIASAQGVISFLSKRNPAFIIYDEAKDFFQTTTSKNSYEVKISTEITKLYSAYSTYYNPPTTKTGKAKDQVVLNKPLFALLAYGHHTLLDYALTKQSIMEGLIPRFIILSTNNRNISTPTRSPISSQILDKLRYHATKSCIYLEEQKQDPNVPINTDPLINTSLLTDDALPIFKEFEIKTNELYDGAVAANEGLEALFSRGVEQSLRLALAMSVDDIDPITMQFTTTLLMNQMQDFYHRFNQTANKTQFAKDTDRLLDKIIDMCAEAEGHTVSKRELQRRTAGWFRNAFDFKTQLTSLMEQGKVEEFTTRTPAGRTEYRVKLT